MNDFGKPWIEFPFPSFTLKKKLSNPPPPPSPPSKLTFPNSVPLTFDRIESATFFALAVWDRELR